MKTIFELKHCDYDYWTDYDDIKFLDKSLSSDDLLNLIDVINDYNDTNIKVDPDLLLKHCESDFNSFMNDLYEYHADDDEILADFKDNFIKIYYVDFEYEILDFIVSDLDFNIVSDILCELGIKIGIAGYSPWSYFIASDVYSDEFINDMYNGYNWYDIIQYSDDGTFLDSCGGFYITNENELINTIKGNFFTDDKDDTIYLVENEASAYIEHEKIKKVATYYEKRFVI